MKSTLYSGIVAVDNWDCDKRFERMETSPYTSVFIGDWLTGDTPPAPSACRSKDHLSMNLTSNTVFITGGGTGIGRGLAETLYQLGNKVIIGGRRQEPLEAACRAHPEMEYRKLDVRDPEQIRHLAADLTVTFPNLNCLINNAGIQRAMDFRTGRPSPADTEAEIVTNFTAVVQLCSAFLPHLLKQERAYLINVSSGLGLIPLSRVPVYSATKAAVHSFTQSLRHQLRGTSVEVIELLPPSVATELRASRPQEAQSGPPALPLDAYIAETIRGLENGDQEIAVGTAQYALSATSNEEVRKIYSMMNR